MDKIEEAKMTLRNAGYIVDALWQIEDAKRVAQNLGIDISDMEEDDLYYLVEGCVNSDYVMEVINVSIEQSLLYK